MEMEYGANRPTPECEYTRRRCTRKSRGGTSLCKQGHSYSAAEGEIGQYCRQSIVPGVVVPVTVDRRTSPRCNRLIKQCAPVWVIVPTVTTIVNLSLSFSQFHHTLQTSVISLLLKKSSLDKDQLSNYRPMSITNLSLLSKIIECSVKSRITDHLSSHNLLTPHQSRAFYAKGERGRLPHKWAYQITLCHLY